jgi:hypothetical protein
MADITDYGRPVMEEDNSQAERHGPETEDDFHFPEEMKDTSAEMDRSAMGLSPGYLLPVPGFPRMGDGEKPAGEKGVGDGAEKDEDSCQVEGLLLDAVCENGTDALQFIVMVAFQAARKLGAGGMLPVR